MKYCVASLHVMTSALGYADVFIGHRRSTILEYFLHNFGLLHRGLPLATIVSEHSFASSNLSEASACLTQGGGRTNSMNSPNLSLTWDNSFANNDTKPQNARAAKLALSSTGVPIEARTALLASKQLAVRIAPSSKPVLMSTSLSQFQRQVMSFKPPYSTILSNSSFLIGRTLSYYMAFKSPPARNGGFPHS